jgi:hypothetical protein
MTLGGAFACAEPEQDETVQETELKKKVKPDGGISSGLTRFELATPSWTSKVPWPGKAFLGNYHWSPSGFILPGEKREVDRRLDSAPLTGTFTLIDGSGANAYQEAISISPGAAVVRKPTGIYVHFSEPLTDRSPGWMLDGQIGGDAWFVKPGQHVIGTPYELNPIVANVADGDLAEVIRPITHIAIKLDAYDVSYPGTSATYSLTEGKLVGLRNTDGSPRFADYVVPHSTRFPVDVTNGALKFFTTPTVAGGTIIVQFNRLEIDDIDVTINGVKSTQKGTSQVFFGSGASRVLLYTVPTHSGVDLPDGNYTIVSTTNTPLGAVVHTETVSFP